MISIWLACCGMVVDRVAGDPPFIPHPVVWMGKWISWCERGCNTRRGSPALQMFLGALTVGSTLVLVYGVTVVVLTVTRRWSPILSECLEIWLISTTIAWNGLVKAGRDVYQCLSSDGLSAARRAVGMIVGRDTKHLDQPEVIRATVETLAENIVDAIVSPVFFACIGGAPLAMCYRAVNTLDSMIGYKNERYLYFGRLAARLDDLLNYLPARISAVLLWAATIAAAENAAMAWRIKRRDARKHPSPNSGIPEAMVAGALGIELGGCNTYGGVPSYRQTLGEPVEQRTPSHILRTIRLVNITSLLLVGLTLAGGCVEWIAVIGRF